MKKIRAGLKKKLGIAIGGIVELAQHGFLYASGFSAAVAIALGKFYLGGFLAVLCIGIVLRFKRGRVADS
jgi:hypothetical protein